MRIHFVGADLEENLGIGILSAVAEKHGHQATIVAFNDVSETDRVIRRIVEDAPDIAGLSIQFQHRAQEFLMLARKLREAGFRGHITTGGQFPTLAYREVLDPRNGVDSVVLHDGEETLVDVLDALSQNKSLHDVAGLALRADDGAPVRTNPRRLLDDLDAVPFARRYRQHNRHMNIPFIPIIGGRGCWGKCSYCSIIAFYDDAVESGGGKAVRMRSASNIAAEMALLLDGAGGKGIFCFHDDNFIFPSEKLSIKRIREIRTALDEYGVGRIAMVGKARPDCVTPTLAKELADLGVIRLYVGVENGSEAGGDHLKRGTQQAHVREALKSCREAGIFVCYNLLVFEPEAKVADVRENVQFIRDHADHPVNFCRAEPYYGTSLHVDLSKDQDLGGSYLGFNYRINDPRAELLFRICSAAFRERNFAPNGVANRYMGLGYAANVLRRFYNERGGADVFVRRARELTRKISLDTAEYLEKAIQLAQRTPLEDWDALERQTLLLGLEIAAADKHWHEELDAIYADMRAFTQDPRDEAPRIVKPSNRFQRLKASVAVGLSLSVSVSAYAGCSDGPTTTSGGGGTGLVTDPVPPDGGSTSSGEGGMVVDPLPPDGGMGGFGGAGGGAGEGGMVVDPPPPDAGEMGLLEFEPEPVRAPTKLRLIDQWFDTSPKTTVRTIDLPLFDPPKLKLVARKEDECLHVRLEGANCAITTRWEGDGIVQGDGLEAEWRPVGPTDRIRVGIRSRGGVAILSLRADGATEVV